MFAYRLTYHPAVTTRDLPLIEIAHQRRIKKSIEEKLKTDPVRYGSPLNRSLRGYYKLRIGEYRVIYEIYGVEEVRIFAIGHRSEIYRTSPRNWADKI